MMKTWHLCVGVLLALSAVFLMVGSDRQAAQVVLATMLIPTISLFVLIVREERRRRRIPNLWTMPERERATMVQRLLTQDDIDAIASDWRAVGDDLRAAIKTGASNTTKVINCR